MTSMKQPYVSWQQTAAKLSPRHDNFVVVHYMSTQERPKLVGSSRTTTSTFLQHTMLRPLSSTPQDVAQCRKNMVISYATIPLTPHKHKSLALKSKTSASF